ncbi:MAG: phytanoyl-CoA dioxygenase family protein, partial [Alphaproteobacteria bacterium]
MTAAIDVDAYKREGYLPGAPLLTAEEAARLRLDCERTCGTEIKSLGRRQASNRVKPYLLYPWAAGLVRHPRILDAVQALIGPDILVFHTTVWLKEPGSESFVPWHQDGTYFGLAPFDHVTAWVAFTPKTQDNLLLRLLHPSHTKGHHGHRD